MADFYNLFFGSGDADRKKLTDEMNLINDLITA
jgi:hypothetical protein